MATLWALLRLRLRSLFRRGSVSHEIRQELQTHIDQEVEELMRAGWSRRMARMEAARRFGDVSRIQQQCQELYMVGHGEGTMISLQNVRTALRGFRRNPLFAASIVLIIGVGIGATTTIFSVADHVLLRPLPYTQPEALMTIGKGRRGSSMSIPDFRDVQERTHAFALLGAHWTREQDFTGFGPPERVVVGQLAGEFFTTLGAAPGAGRLFVVDDFEPVARRSAVLSHPFWLRRWGGDPSVVGSSVRLDGEPYEVVGVLASDFLNPEALSPEPVDVWIPLNPPQALGENRTASILKVVARLADNRNMLTAQEELDALALTLSELYPGGNRRPDGSAIPFVLASLHDATVGDVRQSVLVLLGSVGLMLLIACANVANLTLARATDRTRELALRSALGAGRGRIANLLFTESLLLSLAGGVLGIAMSIPGVEAFAALGGGSIPRLASVTVDWRIVAFAAALSLATAVAFGLLPAVRSAATDVSSALKEGSSTSTPTHRRNTMREVLMAAQAALALMLLVGAGLLFHSFLRLRSVDPGFNVENLLTMEFRFGLPFGWSETRYGDRESKAAFTEQLLAEVRQIPDVVAAGGALSLPFASNHFVGSTLARSDTPSDTTQTWLRPVTHGYLETLGARVLVGRTFTAREERGLLTDPDSPATREGAEGGVPALVNNTLAQRLWPGESPLGSELVFENLRAQVVGVIQDLSHLSLDWPKEGNLYVPFLQLGTGFDRLDLVVRHRGSAESVTALLREAVWTIDPDLPVGGLLTMEDRMSRTLAMPRFYSVLFAAFATFAFLLAASGIYASMSYLVGQRMHEFGIRLALGGPPRTLIWTVMRNGVGLVASGILVGVCGALALSRLLEAYVFGITTTDPITFLGVSLLLGAVAVVACYLPARKAAGAHPTQVLGAE